MSFPDISQVLSSLNLSPLEGNDDITALGGGFEITYDLSRGFNRSDYSTNWLDSDKRNTLLSLQDTKKMLMPMWGGTYHDNDSQNAVYIKNLMIRVNNELTDVAGYPKYKMNGVVKTGAEAVTLAHDNTQTSPATLDPGLLSHVSLPYVGTFYLCRYRDLVTEPTYWRLVRSDTVPVAFYEGTTIIEGKVDDDGTTLEFVAPSSPAVPGYFQQGEKAAIFDGAAIQYPGGYSGSLPFANNIGFRMRNGTDFLSSLSTSSGDAPQLPLPGSGDVIGDYNFDDPFAPPGPGEDPLAPPGPGEAPQLPEVVNQSVTCGANASGITPKQTATITLPDFQSYSIVTDANFNGNLTGTAPNLTYTPTDGFVGDDSFTFAVNDGTNYYSLPATVSITVLPTFSFQRATNISEHNDENNPTILYDPNNPSQALTLPAAYSAGFTIVQGNQTIVIKNPDTNTVTQLWNFVLFTPVVQGTEYEFSFIYSVNEGKAMINLYADAKNSNYVWIDSDATDIEQTYSTTFPATATKNSRIDFQTKFTVPPTDSTEQKLTIKNIIVQEVAAARKTKMKAPLALDPDGLAIGQAFENAKTAFAATITAAADKKVARRDALKSMFVNTSGLLKIKMTRDDLGISSDKLKRENVVVVKSGETIDVSAVNSADESFYCPLANDGDEITLTKGDGSLTVKRQDEGGVEKFAITNDVEFDIVTRTRDGTTRDYDTPNTYDLEEDDVITVTFNGGETIIFFIGSVGDGSETESSGASGDPFLVTLL